MLTAQQHEFITMYIEGKPITRIAKVCGVSRNTIYDWLKKEEVEAELNKRRNEIKKKGDMRIVSKVEDYIANIQELANDTSDKRVCLSANKYLLDRIFGTTANVKNVGDGKADKNEDINVLQDKLKSHLKRVK